MCEERNLSENIFKINKETYMTVYKIKVKTENKNKIKIIFFF